ncbi:hypothetical protein HA402_007567 [Bradysia odoriphaga]|nr:hypothetical protein HA402_007567 [Bradysia odoriphaga]
MERANISKLYTAIVPKRGLGDSIEVNERVIRYSKYEMASLDLWQDQLEPYSISFLENNGHSVERCSVDLCCTLHYNIETITAIVPHYRYAFVVYHGKRTFSGLADGGVVVYAVIACQIDDVATCGIRNETLEFAHHFHQLEIFGTFPFGDRYNYMPNTLDSSIMPLGVNEIVFEQTA